MESIYADVRRIEIEWGRAAALAYLSAFTSILESAEEIRRFAWE